MSDLRKAAEMALEILDMCFYDEEDEVYWHREKLMDVRKALRQALVQPEQEPYASQAAMVAHIADRIRIDPETGNVSIGTLAQALDLQTAIERGTKAWADVPDATEWVEELRGNDKPPVKSYCGGKPNYCTPVDSVYMSEKRVHKTDKSIHEPVCFLRETSWSYEIASWNDPNGFPVYTAPYTKLDTAAGVLHKEWVGLTGKEIAECIQTGEGGFVKLLATYRAIEAKLKEKNGG